jgi:preprotein translocase subunit SecA
MEELRRSVNLRSYGQKDPLNEYKSEAFKFFQELMTQVRTEICNSVFRSATNENAFHNMLSRLAEKVHTDGPQNAPAQNALAAARSQAQQIDEPEAEVELPKMEPIRRELPKIGRNDVVTIRKGMETKELKFKKAEALILNEGWQIVTKQLNT